MKLTLAACLLSAALLPSCASTSAGDYMLNRGGDLVDILRLHVMAGKGASVKLEVTRGVHLGIGWEDHVWAWGLANREVSKWTESVFTWGLILGHHDERAVEGLTDGYYSHSYGWSFASAGGSGFQNADDKNPLDFLTVRGTVMLLLGIDAEVRVGEAIDFLCGIFQFDPAGDDRAYSTYKTLPEPAEAPVTGS
ncbi:MAG TPA: hypothetical protein VK824_03110 [Planctomycetota bacterium]|nr:hypothetical protein [Planctomycetota bacterium]